MEEQTAWIQLKYRRNTLIFFCVNLGSLKYIPCSSFRKILNNNHQSLGLLIRNIISNYSLTSLLLSNIKCVWKPIACFDEEEKKTKQKHWQLTLSANPVGAPAVLVLVFAVRWLSLYYGSYLLDRVRGSLDATVLRTNAFILFRLLLFCCYSGLKWNK